MRHERAFLVQHGPHKYASAHAMLEEWHFCREDYVKVLSLVATLATHAIVINRLSSLRRAVSTRKSCERARRNSAWRSLAATPVAVLLVRGFAVRRWLGPGAELLGAGVPGPGPADAPPGQTPFPLAPPFHATSL